MCTAMQSRASCSSSISALSTKFEVIEDHGFKIFVNDQDVNAKKLVYRIDLSSIKRGERRWEIMDFISEYKGLHLLPCMVALRESYSDDYNYYLVQDLIKHGTVQQQLSHCVEHGNRIKEETLKLWMCQLLLALQALHRRKVIHGAVIPENVFLLGKNDFIRLGPTSAFLTLNQNAKGLKGQISQFKTAKASDSHGGSDRFVTAMTGLESLEHIAPEMFNPTGEIHSSNDIWGVGVLAYKMAAGHSPFTGNTPVHIVISIERTQPDFQLLIKNGYSERFVGLVKKMLLKDAKLRPSAADLLGSSYFPATMNFG